MLAAGARLQGTADGTGSPIIRLDYAFDGGQAMPITLTPVTGQFDEALDLSRLGPGTHTLSIGTADAARHAIARTLTVELPAAILLTVTRHAPETGTDEVGVTFKPQIFFSRPVDAATLNAGDFFATDTTGQKLPARIVPAADGSFAWLLCQDCLNSDGV